MRYLSNDNSLLLKLGLLCFYITQIVNVDLQKQMFNLHENVMRNYKTGVLPRQNLHPINVNITFYLMSLLRFDEIEETLVSVAWLSMSWRDEFLMWHENPEYNNITEIYLKETEIRRPDILLLNTVEGYQSLETGDRLVTVDSKGTVKWEPGHRYATSASKSENTHLTSSNVLLNLELGCIMTK